MATDPLALSYTAAAAAVGVSRRTLERAVRAGQLQPVAVSPRRRVIALTELDRFIQARTVAARAGASV